MHTLQGNFQIKDWQETTQSELPDGRKRSSANVKLEYSGDITGLSELQYLLNYKADGNAEFVGFENINDTAKGQIILKHTGTFTAGIASSEFEVIDCAKDTKLIGKKGAFISGENGVAAYIIDK